jgi:hypothetical protein
LQESRTKIENSCRGQLPGIGGQLEQEWGVSLGRNTQSDELFIRIKNKLDTTKHTQGLDEDSLTEFLFPLLCAHKLENTVSDNFSCENEIRLFYSDSTNPADQDIYCIANKEEGTFAGTESSIDRPFRQLPFNTGETFLRLKAVHLGGNLTERDKARIVELGSNAGIRLNEKA